MLRITLPICLFLFALCAFVEVRAQTPEFLKVETRVQLRTPEANCLGNANAGGTTRTLSPKSKSNDKHYLCLGDSLLIKHDSKQNLSEDPNAATAPGIAYIFYKCAPTISGQRFSQVKADPCVVNSINGVPTTGDVLVARDKPTGDATFVNTGALQTQFNGGGGAPIKFYFAPFTLYNYAATPPNAEGDTACVNVNVSDGLPTDTFSVVYLNKIQLLNLTLSGLGGTFKVIGGLSEYDGSAYTITITNKLNPAIKGTITAGTPVHNGKITFTVPSNGDYLISITDGKSCDAMAMVSFPLTSLGLSTESVQSGDTACVKVFSNNFKNIASAQFILQYETKNLKFIGLTNTSNLPGLDNNSVYDDSKGTLNFGWNTPSGGGVSKPDSTVLFTLCFKAIGPNGTLTPVIFKDTLSGVQVYNADGVVYNASHTDGAVRIGIVSYTLRARADSTLCNNDSTGKLRLIPVGGGAPFTYTYVNSANSTIKGNGTIALNDSAIVSNLPAGLYTISVVNALGEKRDTTLTIKTPNALFVNPPTAVNPLCNGDSNGSLTLATYGGGTQPYSFKWSTGETTVGIKNLKQGIYSCTLTDFHGCQATINGSIGVNPTVIANKNVTGALCLGKNDGTITFDVSGGTSATGNYTLKLNTGAIATGKSGNFTGLKPGTYQLSITDDNKCVTQDSFVIGSRRNLSSNATVSNVSCKGLNNGFVSVVVTASGSETLPYNFNWSANAGNATNNGKTSSINKLLGGKYTLTVFDGDGCRLDTAYTVTEPDSIKLSLLSSRNETCTIGSDGEINIGANGGTPFAAPRFYSYKWNRLAADTFSVLSKVKAGSYIVTVTDAQNCMVSQSFTISVPKLPTIDSFSIRSATCAEKQDGRVKVFARTTTVGTTIKSYAWSNGGIADTITNLSAGKYFITITSSDGCPKIDSATVKAPQVLQIDSANFAKVDPTCPKASTGSISLVIKGGTPPYKYNWSAGPTTNQPVFASLVSGTYTFTVTDANNCTALETSVTLIEPPTISVNFSNIEPISCYGKCSPGDGKATAIASGGTVNNGKYSFLWSSGTNSTNTNKSTTTTLCSGKQSLTVTDAQCGNVVTVDIPSPDSFQFLSPLITPPGCNGNKNGSAEVRIKPGSATPPYSYLWSTGSTRSNIVNVGSGRYTVLITDKNLCPYNYSVYIDQPDSLKLDTVGTKTKDVSCHGLNDGMIQLQRRGGNDGNLGYTWNPNVSQTDSAQNLSAGLYAVTITDSRGCQDSINVLIQEPDKIYFFLAPIVAARCNGDLTSIRLDTAFGGTYKNNFSISVDNGPQYPIGYYIPVFGGQSHQITVQEQFTGCFVDTTVNVPEPPPITVTFNTPFVTDRVPVLRIGLGDSLKLDSSIVKVTTALPLDSVSWTPPLYLRFSSSLLYPTIKPLDDITYKLVVRDANGCIGSGSLAIELERNRNVYIPLIFSPNNDDKNDFFAPFSGTGVRKINFFRIFDRWGGEVYERNDLLPTGDASLYGWDGTVRGVAMPVGVYVYVAEVVFEDGQVLIYRGDVTLVR